MSPIKYRSFENIELWLEEISSVEDISLVFQDQSGWIIASSSNLDFSWCYRGITREIYKDLIQLICDEERAAYSDLLSKIKLRGNLKIEEVLSDFSQSRKRK